jgi:hypothetical protein
MAQVDTESTKFATEMLFVRTKDVLFIIKCECVCIT